MSYCEGNGGLGAYGGLGFRPSLASIREQIATQALMATYPQIFDTPAPAPAPAPAPMAPPTPTTPAVSPTGSVPPPPPPAPDVAWYSTMPVPPPTSPAPDPINLPAIGNGAAYPDVPVFMPGPSGGSGPVSVSIGGGAPAAASVGGFGLREAALAAGAVGLFALVASGGKKGKRR